MEIPSSRQKASTDPERRSNRRSRSRHRTRSASLTDRASAMSPELNSEEGLEASQVTGAFKNGCGWRLRMRGRHSLGISDDLSTRFHNHCYMKECNRLPVFRTIPPHNFQRHRHTASSSTRSRQQRESDHTAREQMSSCSCLVGSWNQIRPGWPATVNRVRNQIAHSVV